MAEIENRANMVRGFNTGRLYQADGQRISWQVVDKRDNGDGEIVRDVLFNDHSRGISGVLTVRTWNNVYPRPVDHSDVLREYDAGRYRYDARADKVRATSFNRI